MRTLFRGFTAILFKEFTIIIRDYTTLFFMFFPPVMQIIAFGYALDNDVKNITTVVLDEDRTVESRQLVEHFVNTHSFRIVSQVGSIEELSAEIRRGHAYVGIQIPPGFTRELHAGHTARVQVLIDGSNSTTAMQALNTSVAVAFRESLTVLNAKLGRTGLPVEVRPQVLYNPGDAQSEFFRAGRDRRGVADRDRVRDRAFNRARTRAWHARTTAGQPALALGTHARQARAVSLHLDDDGGGTVRRVALAV
ncbi:MAG: ABC transporter permease [Pedosphaera sp.]|nr:ABC transporter permease [Pedosphaera sp.]